MLFPFLQTFLSFSAAVCRLAQDLRDAVALVEAHCDQSLILIFFLFLTCFQFTGP